MLRCSTRRSGSPKTANNSQNCRLHPKPLALCEQEFDTSHPSARKKSEISVKSLFLRNCSFESNFIQHFRLATVDHPASVKEA